MELQHFIDYCGKMPGAESSFPFDDKTLVFKVGGKMFALFGLEPPHLLNLKCEPETAVRLRDERDYVIPGYHMHKKHWNSIEMEKNPPVEDVLDWIEASWKLVVGSLPRSLRESLARYGI